MEASNMTFFKIFTPIFMLIWLTIAGTIVYTGMKEHNLMTACAASGDPKSKECFEYGVYIGNIRVLNLNVQD
jgi:hypothetical protein